MTSTIFLVTPCLNAIDTIDRTILSVVTQAGDFHIRYHIQDGQSNDGTYKRVQWWKRRLDEGSFPRQCLSIDFTCSSGPDEGMYDAVLNGFDKLLAARSSFMTWINADDILLAGTLAFIASVDQQFVDNQISWIGGSKAVIRNDMFVAAFDHQLPREVIRAGLCDGIHWPFVQQEGTFFRKWVLNAINPRQSIATMKLAGDWNLWRLFAEHCSLIQTSLPLGAFRVRENQLSAKFRDAYLAEIGATIPMEIRRATFEKISGKERLKRRLLKVNYSNGQLKLVEDPVEGQLERHYLSVFNKNLARPKLRAIPDRVLFEGVIQSDNRGAASSDFKNDISWHGGIYAFDKGWQFPAITEQHAFERLRKSSAKVPDNVIYVAYPWATLIDKIQTKASDAQQHLNNFRHFSSHFPGGKAKRITVCQHILMKEFMYLFEECKIDHIFWSHATKQDEVDKSNEKIRIRPFPLYPVQVQDEQADAEPQRYLYSFVGARAGKYYLSEVRNWILDLLANDPRGLVIGRDSWHYNKVVYDHQIGSPSGGKGGTESLIDSSASAQFQAALRQSTFSLCPSGTGPNSIRLWESIGAGSIPIVLSDGYACPGNPDLWKAAVVFCSETPEAVSALPDRLEQIVRDAEKLASMRHALRQLWMLYGPKSFVYDIDLTMLSLADDISKPPIGLDEAGAFARVLDSLDDKSALSPEQMQLLIVASAGRLLLDKGALLSRFSGNQPGGKLVTAAKKALPAKDATVRHFENVTAHVENRSDIVFMPRVHLGVVPKICLFGRHSHRTPLSYEPFRRLIKGRVEFVPTPDTADLILTGFNLDLKDNVELLGGVLQSRPSTKIVVVSEEPLWDTVWSEGYSERDRTAQSKNRQLRYTFLNHENSTIFDFTRMPYFLLTNDDLLARYRLQIPNYCAINPKLTLDRWRKALIPAAFFAEVRDAKPYDISFPEHDIYGLSTYRTQVAKSVRLPGVMRVGQGWSTGDRRQTLPDWHLDKLAALDGRTRIASSYENTHQRAYISEKIFDAFAVGGIPTYFASPSHRIFDLVAPGAMLNGFDRTPEESARQIAEFEPDFAFAEAWLATAASLAVLFGDTAAIVAERRRVVEEILHELEALL